MNNEYERYPLTCTITLRYLNKDFIEKYLKKWEMDVEEYLSSLLLQKRTEEKTNFINNDVEINGNKIELFQYQRNLISCCSKKNLIYYVCSAKSFIKRGDEYFQLDTGIARDKYSLTNNNIAIFKMILEKIRYNYITKEEVIKWLRGENKKI